MARQRSAVPARCKGLGRTFGARCELPPSARVPIEIPVYRAPFQERSLLVVGYADRIVAFRRSDGAIAWAYELSNATGYPQLGPLAIEFDHDRVLVAKADALLALDYGTGRVVFEVKLPEHTHRPQLIVDGQDIVVATVSLIVCVGRDGSVRWSVPHGAQLHGSPTLAFPGNIRPGDGLGGR